MGKNEVIEGERIYYFDNKPFKVKLILDAYIKFSREELYTIPIWVKLSGLDFKY